MLGARWPEFDLEQKLWTVPAERVKGGREHRVPLAPEALALFTDQHLFAPEEGAKIFPTLGVNALANKLRKIRPGATVHGMHSAFRDWSATAPATNARSPRRPWRTLPGIAPNAPTVEATRRTLMLDWAACLTSKPAEVVPIRRVS